MNDHGDSFWTDSRWAGLFGWENRERHEIDEEFLRDMGWEDSEEEDPQNDPGQNDPGR